MKFDWRSIAHVAALVASGFVPNAVTLEQSVENIADAKSGADKATASVDAALQSVRTAEALMGKELLTPRVELAIRKLNDDSVELLNALSEAHATTK